MELVKDRSNMLYCKGSSDDTGSCILKQFKSMEEFLMQANEHRLTVIIVRGD